MRVTGGQWTGRPIAVPPGPAVRPTPDKVRQAIFNSLGEWILGRTVLELFAGSGALSLECLSRGATAALCVEKNARTAQVLRRNGAAAGRGQWDLRVQDALTALRQLAATERVFEFICADPPYGDKTTLGRRSTSWAQRLLDDDHLPRLLAPGGRLMVGHAKRDQVEIPDPWRERKALKHGDTWIRFATLS